MPFRSAVDYTKLLHLGLIFNPPEPGKKVMVVGGGGGVAPREFVDHYGMTAHVAEIDERVVDIALREDYGFGLRDFDKQGAITFHVGDGRQVLERRVGDTKFDYIILDAYSSGGHIPFHLMTREFLELVRDRLTPNGVVISNLISALEPDPRSDHDRSQLLRAELKTFYAAGFEHVYTFPKLWQRKYSGQPVNIIMVATQKGLEGVRVPPHAVDYGVRVKQQIERRARELLRDSEHPVQVDNFLEWAQMYDAGLQQYELLIRDEAKLDPRRRRELEEAWAPYPILTDDFAPVDVMHAD
jgi:hypothetical protein